MDATCGDCIAPRRVRGLDSLRFFAALWVVLAHIPWFPPILLLNRSEPFQRLLAGLWGNLFNGVSGVIVFFVISGFCIHYPQAIGKKFELLPFYTLRFLRIGIPLLAAIGFYWLIGGNVSAYSDKILWSLYAELIYYAAYPLILVILPIVGWRRLMGFAWVGAALVVLQNPAAGDYHANGIKLTWLLGFPCWLIGCHLAKQVTSEAFAPNTKRISSTAIWPLRGLAWGLGSLAGILRFHTPLGYPWTLNFFAVFAGLWIRREIGRSVEKAPKRVFEWAGSWSYSIYLMHIPIFALILKFADVSPLLNWAALPLVLAGSYIFYLLIEKPGHWLARRAHHAVQLLSCRLF